LSTSISPTPLPRSYEIKLDESESVGSVVQSLTLPGHVCCVGDAVTVAFAKSGQSQGVVRYIGPVEGRSPASHPPPLAALPLADPFRLLQPPDLACGTWLSIARRPKRQLPNKTQATLLRPKATLPRPAMSLPALVLFVAGGSSWRAPISRLALRTVPGTTKDQLSL
jgi:hypothetical protein